MTTSAIYLAFLCGVSLFIGLFLVSQPLTLVFFGDGTAGLAASERATKLLLLLAVIELATTFGATATGLLRGRADTRAQMLTTILAHWIIGAPLGVYMCEIGGHGVTGIWTGLTVGAVLSSAMMLARLKIKTMPMNA